MTARARNGRFTAERTTRTTHEVTERLTIEDTLTELPAMDGDYGGDVHGWAEGAIPGEHHWAQGWDPGPIHPRSLHLAQRRGQCDRAEYHLRKWVVSSAPGEPVPERLIREAVNILRAGPGATLMELEDGRSI